MEVHSKPLIVRLVVLLIGPSECKLIYTRAREVVATRPSAIRSLFNEAPMKSQLPSAPLGSGRLLHAHIQLSLVQAPADKPVNVTSAFHVSLQSVAYKVFNIGFWVQAVCLSGHRRDHVNDRLSMSASHAKNYLDLMGQFDCQIPRRVRNNWHIH